MVAYNFQKQFSEPIKTGTKSHTIRRNSKRRHAQPGEKLQLYTGMRTKSCKKIVDEDPECVFAKPIQIEVGYDEILGIWVDDREIEDLRSFAVMDGFESLEAMHEFWLAFHGAGIFNGTKQAPLLHKSKVSKREIRLAQTRMWHRYWQCLRDIERLKQGLPMEIVQ